MTSAEQLTDFASGARNAVDRSTDLWRKGADQITSSAEVFTAVLAPGVDQAAEQYFEFLQLSLRQCCCPAPVSGGDAMRCWMPRPRHGFACRVTAAGPRRECGE